KCLDARPGSLDNPYQQSFVPSYLSGAATPARGGEPTPESRRMSRSVSGLRAIFSGAVMITLSHLARVVYVFGLSLVLSLLLRPSLSNGQYRGGFMPPMPMMLPLNNGLTDAVGMMGGMGGGMMGGMGGMMGMGGGMMGMMGMGGGMMGMSGMMM